MMESVQKEMTGLLKQNKELKDSVDKYRKAVEQATSTTGDAKRSLDEVLRKMAALESKVK